MDYNALNQKLARVLKMKEDQENQSAQQARLDANLMADDAAYDYQKLTGKEIPPEKRWDNERRAYQISSNPIMRKQADSMATPYYQQLTKVHGDIERARAAGFDETTPAGRRYIRQLQAKNKMYESAGDKVYSQAEQERIVVPDGKGGWTAPPVDITPNMLRKVGGKFVKSMNAGDAGKLAGLSTAIEFAGTIPSNVFNQNGDLDTDVLTTAYFMINDPTGGFGAATKAARLFNVSPDTIDRAQKLVNSFEHGKSAILRIETGAAMTKGEIGDVIKRFMPLAHESKEVAQQKIYAYDYFLNTALNSLDNKAIKSKDKNVVLNEINRAAQEAMDKARGIQKDPTEGIEFDPNIPMEEQGFKQL